MMNIHVTPEIQSRISKQIEKYTNKTEPYVNFLSHITDAYRAAHIPFEEKNIKNLLYQNYVINAITCVEVYFKHTIVHRRHLWSEAGINKLMEARITLKDATKLLSNKDVTPAVIISHYTTFSNLDSISYNISLLTDSKIDFISGVEKQMSVHRSPENNIFEEWQSVIGEIFEYRHEFVHSKSEYQFTENELSDCHSMLNLFVLYSEIHLANELLENASKKSVKLLEQVKNMRKAGDKKA